MWGTTSYSPRERLNDQERVVHNRVKSNIQHTQSQGVTAQSQTAKSKGGHPESRASTSKLKHQGIHEELNERVGQE